MTDISHPRTAQRRNPIARMARCIVCSLLVTQIATADDWPQWLGPKRDSVWREKGILEAFPEHGPRLTWKSSIGKGYSGPAVAKGRVFVMDRIDSPTDPQQGELLDESPSENTNFVRRKLAGTERVVCLNADDGKECWTYTHKCDYTMVATYANGPRVTPAVDGDLVFALGAEGHLVCLRAADGDKVWSRELRDDFGLETPLWGFSSHPLIDGNLLYVMIGGRGSTVVAFEKTTGKEVWRALSANSAGYASPVISKFGQHRQLVVWHSEAVCGLNPDNGRLAWSLPAKPTYAMSIGLPVAKNGRMLLMSFARKSWMVKVDDSGDLADIEWEGDNRHGIGGVMNTPLIVGDHVYGCGANGRYTCARLSDGKHEWTTYQPTTGKRPAQWATAFTIKHEDRFFVVNDLGEVIIARMTPKGYEEVSRANLIEPDHDIGMRKVVWSHPAFANQSIYLRNESEIRCYSLAR